MQLKFEVTGQTQLSRNLRTLVVQLPNMAEFYKDAMDLIEARSDELFAQRGQNAEKAEKWRALSPRTVKAREKRWGYYKRTPSNPSVLRWTGRLQTDRTKTIEKNRAIFEFNAPYAIYHQTGGGRLPKRAIIDLDNNTNREIVRALQSKIQRDIGIFGTQI